MASQLTSPFNKKLACSSLFNYNLACFRYNQWTAEQNSTAYLLRGEAIWQAGNSFFDLTYLPM